MAFPLGNHPHAPSLCLVSQLEPRREAKSSAGDSSLLAVASRSRGTGSAALRVVVSLTHTCAHAHVRTRTHILTDSSSLKASASTKGRPHRAGRVKCRCALGGGQWCPVPAGTVSGRPWGQWERMQLNRCEFLVGSDVSLVKQKRLKILSKLGRNLAAERIAGT